MTNEKQKDLHKPTRWTELDIFGRYLDKDVLKAIEETLKDIKVEYAE
jgi:hypothetical protein